MKPDPYGGVQAVVFPLRPDCFISIAGLPADLTVRDVERLVRYLRVLPAPGSSVEVCACGMGAADPGWACPWCGEQIPETLRDISDQGYPPGFASPGAT